MRSLHYARLTRPSSLIWAPVIVAALAFGGCQKSAQGALPSAALAQGARPEGGIAEPFADEESGALESYDERLVRMRAEAWPSTESPHPWRALEEGGVLVTGAESERPWRVIMLSRDPSAWADGVLIELPAALRAEQVPVRVQVRTSPTPREITRSAWPAISRLLVDEGEARIVARPGQAIALMFPEAIRVSIVELVVHESLGNSSLGLGRVRLVRGGVVLGASEALRVPLEPSEAQEAPVDAGVLEGMSR